MLCRPAGKSLAMNSSLQRVCTGGDWCYNQQDGTGGMVPTSLLIAVCALLCYKTFGLVLVFTSLSSRYSFLNTDENEPKTGIRFHI